MPWISLALASSFAVYGFLRKTLPKYIRVSSDKKSGLISVEVDDEEPKFAADLANGYAGEITKLLPASRRAHHCEGGA